MAKLLFVIDPQVDFITGSLANKEAERKVPNIVAKIKNHNGIIIATHDTHFDEKTIQYAPAGCKKYSDSLEGKYLPEENGLKHCIKFTPGWEFEPSIKKALMDKNGNDKYNFHAIDKYTFGYKDWEEYLSGLEIDEIEIVGFCTDICVVSNALILRAIMPNVPITVDGACCAGTSIESHKAALDVMGINEITVINREA